MLAALALSISLISFAGCIEDDPEYNTTDFAHRMAEASCSYIFTCCDSAETETLLGSGASESGCITTMRSTYLSYYRDVDAAQWNAKDAVGCIDQINQALEGCPRNYDVTAEADQCNLVTPTKNAGDLCENSWDCSTQFCKSGVCANPLPEGATCTEEDRCETGVYCVNGTCKGLQPDGAVCTVGTECISGACGNGECVQSKTYTCDGE
jgi:hypothetical protein